MAHKRTRAEPLSGQATSPQTPGGNEGTGLTPIQTNLGKARSLTKPIIPIGSLDRTGMERVGSDRKGVDQRAPAARSARMTEGNVLSSG